MVAIVVTAVAAVLAAGPGNHRGLGGNASGEAGVGSSLPTSALSADQRDQTRANQVRASLGALPLAFEANQGQIDPRVKYMARGQGYTLFLTANDAVFVVRSASDTKSGPKSGSKVDRSASARSAEKDVTAAVYMHLAGGNSQAQIAASHELPGHTNYFLGSDRSKWQHGVKQYAAVSYHDVYPGVNLAFRGEQRQVEFDFVVAPQANASPIGLQFSEARAISTDGSGRLTLATAAGNVTLHPPVAYQEVNGVRQIVDARFVLKAENEVGFALGSYDRNRELVIDPAVSYATYLGGSAEDDGHAIAIDGSGNAYVTGQTKSTDFPKVGGIAPNTNAGSFDVFVSKISPDGSALLYSTYVGGSGDDSGNSIAVDTAGHAFVAGGTSSTNFPTKAGSFQTTFGGVLDAFAFELGANGDALTYSTYLGGSNSDVANGIALHDTGSGFNAYIAGYTYSDTDFPLKNALQATMAGASNGFVTVLNPSGSGLVYSTYLGGGSNDFSAAIAVDSSGKAYVTGATQYPAFPTTTGAFQTTCGSDGTCDGGLTDAYVSVIKADGSGFTYSTFLGGGGADTGLGVAVDSAGDAYVTGVTESTTDFPKKSALQGTFGGGVEDAFVSELNPTGSALVYSTYLGGSGDDSATSIAVDGSQNAFVTGRTTSPNFPLAGATQGSLNGGSDAFVSNFNAGGSSLVFSTYIGGSHGENTSTAGVGALGAIAVDSGGTNIYIAGNTISDDFPVSSSPAQATYGGAIDAYVVKFSQPNFAVTATDLAPASVNPGSSATSTVTLTASGGFNSAVALTCNVAPSQANGPTCSFNPASKTPPGTSALTVNTTASTPSGDYTITVVGTSGAIVQDGPPLSLTVTGPDFTIAGTALTALAQGGSTTSTITIAALNGYTGTVNFTCAVSNVSGGSPLPTCSIPTAVSGGAGTSTLTVSTTGAARAMNYSSSNLLYAMWLPVVGLSLVGMRFSTGDSRRKKLLGFLLLGVIMAALFFLPACGGSNGGGGGGGGGCSGCTPKGSYTVTVTGTDSVDSALTHSVSPALTLTVN